MKLTIKKLIRRTLLATTFSLFPSLVLAQTGFCGVFADPNFFYVGPDSQYLVSGFFTDVSSPISEEVKPYLQRIAKRLEMRGTTLITEVIPYPAFAFVGKMDKEKIKNTVFEKFNTPESLNFILDGYQKTINSLRDAGLNPTNLMESMLKYRKKFPNDPLFFKHDAHWHPFGARAAAFGIRDDIASHYPELFTHLNTEKLEVKITGVKPRKEPSGWNGAIKANCPEYQPSTEQIPTLKLESSENQPVTSESLFATNTPNIVLFGTSFSINDFGFTDFLSSAFGNRVINASINGGGALGSFMEFFLKLKPEEQLPSLIIWELPFGQLQPLPNFKNRLNSFGLRQILPLLDPSPIELESSTLKLEKKTTYITKNLNIKGENSFVHIHFDALRSRGFKANLKYIDGTSENVIFLRTHGDSLNDYYLELSNKYDSSLSSIELEFAEQVTGNVTISSYKYSF